jgi:hypothetical protein
LRLFACVCYQRITHLLHSPLARSAVEVAERFADGEAGTEELQRASERVRAALDDLESIWRASHGAERTALQPRYEALALALQITRPESPKAAYYASSNAYLTVATIANPGVPGHDPGFSASRAVEERAQADLLRDVFGSLPLGSARVDPRRRTTQVLSLAQAACEERIVHDPERPGWLVLDPARLLVLADALEEAGAADADLLGHLRGPGPHVKGCFAVEAARS